MKAVKLVAKKKLEVAGVDKPSTDGGSAIIKVINCGICGSDIHYWEDGQGMGGAKDLIMGHEFGGVLEDPGLRNDLTPGDRVTAVPGNPCGECGPCKNGLYNLCVNVVKRPHPGLNSPGAYAEYIAVRPDMVRKLPDSISDLSASMIEPSAVAFHAVACANLRPGSRCLVVGAGTIGLLCAAWLRICGASYIAMTEVNAERRELAGKLGDLDEVFDARDEKLNSKIKRVTAGGVDVAIDASAADAGINSAFLLLKPKGTLILAGVSLKPQSIMTLIALAKEITIKPIYAYLPSEFDSAIDFIARGALKTERFVSRTIGMDEVQAAFEDLHSGRSKDVKVVVKV
jgi:(R,R)-butanediol dehydrogenase/meso-butanediol dehydrogenase/diacetyl reductase